MFIEVESFHWLSHLWVMSHYIPCSANMVSICLIFGVISILLKQLFHLRELDMR